jgi:hypothetical protein
MKAPIIIVFLFVALAVAGLRPLPTIPTDQLHTETCTYVSEADFYACHLDETAPVYTQHTFTKCQLIDDTAMCFK